MFKFRSYNVKKETEKNEKQQPPASAKTPTYSAMTLKKPPKKEKKKASPAEITHVNNKQSPDYSKRKTVTVATWQKNKTYSPKNENTTEKVVIPKPHKKLERT